MSPLPLSTPSYEYVDDADYDRFVQKTVQQSLFTWLIDNIMLVFMYIAAIIAVCYFIALQNPLPLIVMLMLIGIYKGVWVKL
jgi:hypothetical protein